MTERPLTQCSVQICENKVSSVKKNKKIINFHRFPFRYHEILKKWIEFCNRGASFVPDKKSLICSEHFEPSAYENSAPLDGIKLFKTARLKAVCKFVKKIHQHRINKISHSSDSNNLRSQPTSDSSRNPGEGQKEDS